jgi:hypothetical protein
MDKLVAFHQKLPQQVTLTIKSQLPIGSIESADWQLGQFGVDYNAFQLDMEAIVAEPGLYIMADEELIESSKNATWRLCPIEKDPDPVIVPDKPWEGGETDRETCGVSAADSHSGCDGDLERGLEN